MTARILFVIAAVAAALLVPAAAFAKAASSDVSLTFTDNEPIGGVAIPVINPDNPDTFSGAVTSKDSRCFRGRTVTVYKKDAKGKATKVISATTGDDGKWTIDDEDPGSGTYFASVARSKTRTSGKTFTCTSGKTKDQAVTDS